MRTLAELKAAVDAAPSLGVIEMSAEELKFWFESDKGSFVSKGVFVGAPQIVDPAAQLLDQAKAAVTGPRREKYGPPELNLKCTADLWTTFVQRRFRRNESAIDPVVFTAADVASMMVLLKMARLAETPDHHDSALDVAGYIACHARCSGAKP